MIAETASPHQATMTSLQQGQTHPHLVATYNVVCPSAGWLRVGCAQLVFFLPFLIFGVSLLTHEEVISFSTAPITRRLGYVDHASFTGLVARQLSPTTFGMSNLLAMTQ